MTQEMRDFYETHPSIEQGRQEWLHENEWIEKGKEFPVTVVIAQRNTKDLIQLSIESIQRFYPDINIVVIDGGSNDDSLLYLKYKELATPNVKIRPHNDRNGHGWMLHLAMMENVESEYVLVMDSDVVIMRGGFIEDMLKRFAENTKLYAIGTMQYSSYKNNGGEPESPEDAIPYANPQLSLYHLPTYKELDTPFIEDGTPCILNMKAAKDSGLDVEYYPTDKYSCHLGGGSWVSPRNIWPTDLGVKIRPFLTIIMRSGQQIESKQKDTDYDIVITSEEKEWTPPLHQPIMAPSTPTNSAWKVFGIRFNVMGEYVMDASSFESLSLPSDFIFMLKMRVIESNVPDEVEVYGFKCVKRNVWQRSVR